MRKLLVMLSTVVAAAVIGAVVAAPAAALPSRAPVASAAVGVVQAPVQADGPHAGADRKPAKPVVRKTAGAIVADVDLGNLDLTEDGKFRAPVRGLIVAPAQATPTPAPMIVMAHLRSPGCTGDRTEYPCASGTTEIRYDRGMEWLAVKFAEAGYAVVVPDLAPVYVQAISKATGGYNQYDGARRTIDALRGELIKSAGSGTPSPTLGTSIPGKVQTDTVAMWVHSRSGELTPFLAQAWKNAPEINAVFAYAPSYAVGIEGFGPPLLDVPYLGLVGTIDGDVSFSAVQLLTEHIGAARKAPAFTQVVRGLGHNYVNRALSESKTDDRTYCDGKCRTAVDHERIVGSASLGWFAQVLGAGPAIFPATGTAPLPTSVAGEPARLLASTNGPATHVVVGSGPEKAAAKAVSDGHTALCSFPSPGGGDQKLPAPQCNLDPLGDFAAHASVLRLIDWRTTGGVSFSVPESARAATHLAVHLGPAADRPVGDPGTPVRITLTSAGTTSHVDLPANDPALANRKTKDGNGQYVVGTVRIDLSTVKGFVPGSLTSVTIGGTGKPGAIYLRGYDFAGGAAAGPGTTQSTTPSPNPETTSGTSPGTTPAAPVTTPSATDSAPPVSSSTGANGETAPPSSADTVNPSPTGSPSAPPSAPVPTSPATPPTADPSPSAPGSALLPLGLIGGASVLAALGALLWRRRQVSRPRP